FDTAEERGDEEREDSRLAKEEDRHREGADDPRDRGEEEAIRRTVPVQLAVPAGDGFRVPQRLDRGTDIPAVRPHGIRQMTPQLEEDVLPDPRVHPAEPPVDRG